MVKLLRISLLILVIPTLVLVLFSLLGNSEITFIGIRNLLIFQLFAISILWLNYFLYRKKNKR